MMILLLTSTLVYQNGDTLVFMKNDEIVDTIVVAAEGIKTGNDRWIFEQTRVAPDNRTYLVYRAVYDDVGRDSLLSTTIAFYDAEKKKLFEEKVKGERNISFELSDIHDSLFVITTWDRLYSNPSVWVIKKGKKTQIIKEGDWQKVVSSRISPNSRYFLFHVRKPYYNQLWDYVFFYDLETGKSWDYIFPTCLSCKKARIDLEIYDSGRSEVVHKNEHRVFSPEGVLEDIYMKLQ